ncbi:hypothetical protein CRP01_30655 [Flavilitoribacter nigricans DSM 23189 = NBRC 102662]|uniref:Uncharacterized protein n=1 Tax=Flavilitoribacter nigricans (strain ATCC 23147 / DSM 23189 / NBRC 102662 / NCIMB 1420 / SS-2) TaxID=1122177 RepID=A0A2D0N2S4_FLAN2|nr:hypothetical protein CRP01_30655 [Flavilitoribacter nigricans DSM 23189 = NBRC 102662]
MNKTSPIKGLFDVGGFDGRMAVVSRTTAIRPLSHLSFPDTEQRIIPVRTRMGYQSVSTNTASNLTLNNGR